MCCWCFGKKSVHGFPLQHAGVCVKLSPIRTKNEKKKALLTGCELRDQMKNRRQIIIETLWEHRWRETAPRCLMCGWVTATSRAGLTQPISRSDTGASLQRRPTFSTKKLRRRLARRLSLCLQLLLSPLPEQWREDVYCCQCDDGVVASWTVMCSFAWVNIYLDLSSLVS